MQIINVNLFGRHGSGKGTQTGLLVAKYNLGILGTGSMIREEIARNTPLGHKFSELINHGQLVADADIYVMFKKFFETYPKNRGIIFDGVPRTLEQKKFFDEHVATIDRTPINIEIVISEETSLARQMSRNEKRKDQNEEVAKTRIKIYEEKVQPVVDAYRNEGKMLSVAGEQPIEKVFSDICKLLEAHGHSHK